MYENGNTQFIEILCASQSIGDFLNNAEYITTISEYDRDMLTEFQEVVETVEKQEKELQEEYDDLEVMQNDLIAKQTEVESTISSKDAEISELDTKLGDAKATLLSWKKQQQRQRESRTRQIMDILQMQAVL